MELTRVPAARRQPLQQLADTLLGAQRIVLLTHVNADGDGAGSQAAIAAWLTSLNKEVHITNPTIFPEAYRYLVRPESLILDHTDARAASTIRAADLVFVLDTGEPKRLGRHMEHALTRPIVVLDHHPPAQSGFRGTVFLDDTACATGELVYDLLLTANFPDPWPASVTEGIYTAITTDTGSFRFSNTTPRTHALAGDMIARGVDPETMYRRLFGTVPLRRIQLLRSALEHLEADSELPLTWITITREAMLDSSGTSEDLEGMVEYARSIEGTELAILFRETPDGSTKISFRSNGVIDVNALARQFAGGGHIKAAGALVAEPLDRARAKVLEAARTALRRAL